MRAILKTQMARRRRVAAASGPFTLLSLGAKLVEWWNPDDLANAAVSAWTGRKAGLVLAQGTAGNQPVKAAASWTDNSKAGVTFATDDYLTCDPPTGIPAGATPSWFWGCSLVSDLAGSNTLMALGTTTAGPTDRRMTFTGIEALQLLDSDGSTVSSASGAVLGSHLVAGHWYVDGMEGLIDGVQAVVKDPLVTPLNTTADRFRVGALENATAAAFFNGVVRHVAITTELTTLERQKVEGFLAWDCGMQTKLDVSHPYRSAAP